MKHFIHTLLIIIVATITSAAQDVNLFEAPNHILGGLNEETEGVVGAIGGTVDVSALGGATYTIPIQVPEGIHGIQPNLSIVYNSQSGNDWLGWGWSFSGTSAITRGKCSLYYEGGMSGIQFNLNIFHLDGQRLLLVDDTHFEYSEYHNEIDDMSKIVCYRDEDHSPDYFKVWLSNGLIAYYGNTSNSKIKLQEAEHTCMWLLSRIEDRDGNYMEYHYNTGGAHYFLDWIQYAGNTNVNLNPAFKIQFNYEQREPETVETMFIVKNDLNMSKLLKSICVYKKASTDWNLIQSYTFNYLNRDSDFGLYIYDRLESIDYACIDNSTDPVTEYHYNPTKIKWGEFPEIYNGNINPPFTKGYKTVIDFQNGSSNREQKYVGDFNGDGLSDFIETKEDGLNMTIKQFINMGNTKTGTIPGEISFEMKEFSITEIDNTRVLWVYVCDFNGDGCDDFLLLYDRASSLPYGEKKIRAYKSIVENGNYRAEQIFHQLIGPGSTPTAVFTGDFKGRGKSDIIIQISSDLQGTSKYPFIYLEYMEDSSGCTMRKSQAIKKEGNQIVEQWSFPVSKYATGDFDNDGRTEIWAADENESGCFYRIEGTAEDHYSHFPFLAFSNGHTTPFVGDFNGDGVSDLLFHNGNHWYVKICATPEAYGYFTYNLTHELNPVSAYIPPYFGYDKDHRQNNMTYYLDIADINGDGKSDVIVINIHGEAHIFYGPIIPGYRSFRTPNAHFAYKESFDASSAGLSNNMFTRCIGNFFGQENQAILDDAIVFSTPPLSTYYGVTSITDGMGNCTEFDFGYLTENPHEGMDIIYTLSREEEDLSRNIFAAALPIKAVKKITSSNIAEPNLKSISEYTYNGILVHRKGKGVLGLTKNTLESYIEGAPFHNYLERHFSTTAMGEHCALMPTEEKTYLKKVANGHLKRITKTTFTYDKHVHTKNDKVFMPLLTDQVTDFYDIYHQEDGVPIFMKRNVSHNNYSFWSGKNVIDNKTYYTATTVDDNITNYQDCEFLGNWGYDIFENDINNWLIQRPVNVGVGNGQLLYEDIYYYDSYKPHQLKSLVRYPQQHYASEYATRTDYTYDAAGNIKTETLSEENGNNLKPRKTEYFYRNYRLLKTKREWLDENADLYYDTEYDYDPYLDFVTKETNCRGQVTQFNQDPLGIVRSTISPNGIETHTQTGWLPDNTGYYQWTHTQGSSPTLTTYDMTGRVHKVETYGFNENQLIVKNYYYNNMGQLEREEDAHCDDEYIPTTTYYYDNYGALRKTIYPNGNTTRIKHDDEDRFKILTETTTAENEVHTTAQMTNAIGQVVTSWDEANNAVSYTYTLDGLLETATVNNDPNTTITIEYDEARNRIRLHDPDYCGNGNDLISSYDAFGQLKTTTTPKGDITSFDYDAFGRTITRTEGNDITQWFFYDSEPQFKGLLKTVSLNEGQEKTTYEYDPSTRRLVSTLETINGITYNPTKYSYNELGKTETIQYPSGIKIGRNYTSTGHLQQITDDEGKNLWTTEEKNGMGQVTLFSTGESTSTLHGDYKYYKKTHLLENQLVKDWKGNIIHHFWYKYDNFSNLERRTTDIYWISERFLYDELNRLTNSLVEYRNNNYISDIEYDDNDFGCIKSKTAAYDGAPSFVHAEYGHEGRPHAIRTANMDIEAFPTAKLETQYTSFDKLSSIIQYDDNGEIDRSLSYQYGYDHQRIYMVESDGQDVIRTKTYLGNCEYISENGKNKVYTYLTGPLGLFAVYEQENSQGQISNEKLHYLFTDHLGSITTIVDNSGNVEQRLSYDAWGNLRNAKTWCSAFVGTPMLDRGFTGHEHLYSFSLINMNGRMYDPVMSCFLSPDNYIQSPENSQSFNRYAYCMNNPLKYTDPDGEYWHLIIGALIGGTANVLANLKHIENFGQGLAYFGIGALAGGLSAGIGAGVGTAYAGGSFAAGFLGTTVQAAPCALGFAGGFAVGGSSGFTSAFITASGNKWMQHGTFAEGMFSGMKYGVASGLIGGVAYGAVGALAAASKGFHPGTGQQYIEKSFGNRRMPIVRQNGKNNCMAAATESMSSHKGDTPIVTQDDVRGWFPDNANGPLDDVEVFNKYEEVTGRQYFPYATKDHPKLTISYEEIKHDMLWEPNSDFMISRKFSWQSTGHEVNINRMVERSYKTLFGEMKTDYLYEVMDPYYGGYRIMKHEELLKSTNLFKIR